MRPQKKKAKRRYRRVAKFVKSAPAPANAISGAMFTVASAGAGSSNSGGGSGGGGGAGAGAGAGAGSSSSGGRRTPPGPGPSTPRQPRFGGDRAAAIRTRFLQDRRLFPEPPAEMRARFERARSTLARVPPHRAHEALGIAVMDDDPDAVARAMASGLASGVSVNASVYNFKTGKLGGLATAVYVAARYNKLRALRFLLCATGADPNADCGRDSDSISGRDTPFFAACCDKHHDAARILFACGATPDHCTTGSCKCPLDIHFPE